MQAESYECVNIECADMVQCSVDGEVFGLSLHFLRSGRERGQNIMGKHNGVNISKDYLNPKLQSIIMCP